MPHNRNDQILKTRLSTAHISAN